MRARASSVFSKYGEYLFIISFVVMFIAAIFLPNLVSAIGLFENQTYPLTFKIIVRLTVGSWSATIIPSLARAINWYRAMNPIISSEKFFDQKREATTIQTFFLWVLGIMTAISGYITAWFLTTGVEGSMSIIQVSIYFPPSGLIVKKDKEVKVEGWLKRDLMRAETFQNLNPEGPVYRCGVPSAFERARADFVIKIGVVKEVKVLKQSIDFVMETAE